MNLYTQHKHQLFLAVSGRQIRLICTLTIYSTHDTTYTFFYVGNARTGVLRNYPMGQ